MRPGRAAEAAARRRAELPRGWLRGNFGAGRRKAPQGLARGAARRAASREQAAKAERQVESAAARAQLTHFLAQLQIAEGTWCSGITPAQHAGGPGFNPQCVHLRDVCCFSAAMHNRLHDVCHRGDLLIVVAGDWHEGVWAACCVR